MAVIQRRDLGTIARLGVVAVVAYLSANDDAALLSVALVTLLAAWPISIVIPMRWRGELEERDANRYSTLFLAAFVGIFVVAYGDAQEPSYPSTALLVGFAAAHLLAVWLYLHPRASDLWSLPAWVGASVLFIAGVLADLPDPLGWSSLTFGLYGVAGGAVIHRIQVASDAAAAEAVPGS